jgi:hypothetical protein
MFIYVHVVILFGKLVKINSFIMIKRGKQPMISGEYKKYNKYNKYIFFQ